MTLSADALTTHWSQLSDPWQRAFALGWESFCAGDLGVGAVVVDPAGTIVSTGRARRQARPSPAGELAGNNLAHAEINALIKLPFGSYDDHAMLTTLEPCLLCTGAMRLSHIGQVEFAAADPVWRGVERLPELNRHIARRWTARVGPMDGPLSQWASLVPLVTYAERGLTGVVIDDYRAQLPALFSLADRIAADPAGLARVRKLPLPEAFTMVDTPLADHEVRDAMNLKVMINAGGRRW